MYSMRSFGQGYASIGKFNALMNIPPPITKNNFETLRQHHLPNNKIASFTKDVTEETVRDAAIELHNNTANTNNSATVQQIPVFRVMGNMRSQRFFKQNGVFAAISLDNGEF